MMDPAHPLPPLPEDERVDTVEDTNYDSDMDSVADGEEESAEANNEETQSADNDTLQLAAWFIKKAPGKAGRGAWGVFGKDQRRFCELYRDKIKYFSEMKDNRGVPETERGQIDITSSSDPRALEKRLVIANPDRFWDLTAEADNVASQWLEKIKANIGEQSNLEEEVNMYPGRGEWFMKKGKGIGALVGDKRRYLSLFYNKNAKSLRFNYFVQLAGRARVPIHKKGYIAINTSSKIECDDKRLMISNPGFLWQLTANSSETAERWSVSLHKAVNEIKDRAKKDPTDTRIPLLARAVEIVQNEKDTLPTLEDLREMLTVTENYPTELFTTWEIELAQLLDNTEFLSFAMKDPPIPGAWFMKQPEGMGKERRRWFEITAFDELTYFARLSEGESGQPVDQRGMLPIRFDSTISLVGCRLTVTSGGRTWVLTAENADLGKAWLAKLTELVEIKKKEPRHRRPESLRARVGEKKIVPDRGSWLSDDARMKVMMLVRDGKLSVEDAIAQTWDSRPENYGTSDSMGMTLAGSQKLMRAKSRNVTLTKESGKQWNLDIVPLTGTDLHAVVKTDELTAVTSSRVSHGDIILSLCGKSLEEALANKSPISDDVDSLTMELVDSKYIPGCYTFRLPRPSGLIVTEGPTKEKTLPTYTLEPGSNAANAGVSTEMALVKIGDKNTVWKTKDALSELLTTGLPGSPIKFTVRRLLSSDAKASSGERTDSERAAQTYINWMIQSPSQQQPEMEQIPTKSPPTSPKDPNQSYENWEIIPPPSTKTTNTTSGSNDNDKEDDDMIYANVVLNGKLRKNRDNGSHSKKPARRLTLDNLRKDMSTQDTSVSAVVLYNFIAKEPDEMELRVGETIIVANPDPELEWWEGVATQGGEVLSGLFPSAYVAPSPRMPKDEAISTSTEEASESQGVTEDEPENEAPEAGEEEDSSGDEDPLPDRPKKSSVETVASGAMAEEDSPRRARIVKELIETEEDYVGHLSTIVNGYIMRMRPMCGDLFEESAPDVFFSNIEQIEQRQKNFLALLKESVASKGPSGAASCFLEHPEVFSVYSVYCNNHDRGNRALDLVLSENEQVWQFFEASRMMLVDQLSVAALMIKPVQRVCQYPLMLQELLKATPEGHPDYQNVEKACDMMKEVALTINEDKRLKEQVKNIENKIDGWEGPDISVYSSRLFLEGVVTKVSGVKGAERYLFLFDNLIVITRPPIKGRHKFARSGKIFTHECELEDVPDNEFVHNGNGICNAFKLFNHGKNKWYVLYTRTLEEKKKWLEAFAKEREQVKKDSKAGFSLLALAASESSSAEDYVKGFQGRNKRTSFMSFRGRGGGGGRGGRSGRGRSGQSFRMN
eukprot:m.26570 g.26570  ORF g.26570 m.26570 type:complete len:1345 (-) comp7810_c0_seq1:2-4036(-)